MANIKNELNNIKSALYGKDVRNSIHDAIEQCYTDASINGNANMEVTQARGEYETLGERLDDYASQLARIEGELEEIQVNINKIGCSPQNTSTENSNILINFIENNKNNKVKFFIPDGEYRFNEGLTLYPQHNFEGMGSRVSVLIFENSSDTDAFTISDNCLDSSYAYSYINTYFKNITVKGEGDEYGNNANRNGLILGKFSSNELINTPLIRFEDVFIEGFNKGLFIEGYGHTLKDIVIRKCNEGVLLTHPEQVMMLNPWIEYCHCGLILNPVEKLGRHYGHNMQVLGGAIQRNHVGTQVYNFMDFKYHTYSELNSEYDLILGDKNDVTNYELGVKNVDIKLNTDGNYLNNSICFSNVVYGNIRLCNYSSNRNKNDLYVSGYSKYLTVNVLSELIGNVVFDGDCMLTCLLIKDNVLDTISTDKTLVKLNSKYGLKGIVGLQYIYDTHNLVFDMMNNSNVIVKSSTDWDGLKIVDGRSGQNNQLLANFTPRVNEIFINDLEIKQSGRGLVLTSDNGQKRARLKLNDDGSLGVVSI